MYYDRFRFSYPDELFTVLCSEMPLSNNDRVLDLGCGTGQLTFPISPFVKEVVGIDPDEAMIEIAKSKLLGHDGSNVRFYQGSSWDIPLDDTSYNAVIMGESFHWMDRQDVLERLGRMLPETGRVAIVSRKFEVPEAIRESIERTRVEYLGPERRAGAGSYTHPQVRHEEILRRSPFKQVAELTVNHNLLLDVDHLVGFQYSTSYGATRHFGTRLNEYDHTLRSRLTAIFPSDTISVPAEARLLIGRRVRSKER